MKVYAVNNKVRPSKKTGKYHYFPYFHQAQMYLSGPFTYSQCGVRCLSRKDNQIIPDISEDEIYDLANEGKLCERCYIHLVSNVFE